MKPLINSAIIQSTAKQALTGIKFSLSMCQCRNIEGFIAKFVNGNHHKIPRQKFATTWRQNTLASKKKGGDGRGEKERGQKIILHEYLYNRGLLRYFWEADGDEIKFANIQVGAMSAY